MKTSFWRRFHAWVDERFPLANGLLFLTIYLAAVELGRRGGALRPLDAVGFIAAWSFFLMLRVFDEHKDFEGDQKLYPERVLQRGLVTLGHLKVVGGLAIAVQLATSLGLDGGLGAITIHWLVVFGWSLLMLVEFFVHEWLGRRLVLYAFSHLLVLPLAVLWMAQMGAGGAPLGPDAYAFAAMSFFIGFSFEIARKMKAPADERDGVQTYTKILGVRRATVAVAALWTAATALLGATVALAHGSGALPALLGGVVVTWAPTLLVLWRFSRSASAKAAKACLAMVSLSALLANGVVAFAASGGGVLR